MKARAGVTVSPPTRLVDLRSEAPLTLRWADGCLYVVGSAFAPLGGDELELDVTVEAGATLTVRTVAASVAQPSPDGRPSHLTVTARVADGATLRWLPEPGIAATGAVHHTHTRLDLAVTANVVWREEVILGRHDEPGGQWHSHLDVTLDGRPLLRQDTAAGGPHWDSQAVAAGARASGTLLAIGPMAPTAPRVLQAESGGWAAVMPLARPGAALTSALAPTARSLRWLLERAQGEAHHQPGAALVGLGGEDGAVHGLGQGTNGGEAHAGARAGT